MKILKLSLAAPLLLAVASCGEQNPHSSGEASEVVIVLPVGTTRTADPVQGLAAIKEIAAEIRKQPGLVDARVLEGKTPNVQPRYVHVMRWRSQADWEALSASSRFQDMLTSRLELVDVRLAQVYGEVE